MKLQCDPSPDLRSSATPPFEATLQPVPAGVLSPYGPQAPFGSPAFALRDAADITPRSWQEPHEAIAGWRVTGSLWPRERFALRIPRAWNGRLVVAGCPGQRTEFACDRLFGDPLLARGYAYVCGNKGNGDGAALLEADVSLDVDGVRLPRFAFPDGRRLVLWQHAPGHLLERWVDEMVLMTQTASDVIARTCGRSPELVYAVGLSNGGYQVRRAVEESDLFAGALTWNAVYWSPENNLVDGLAAAVAAMEAGRPERLSELGFPPDVRAASGSGSLYFKNLLSYWYVTLWLHAMHLDPETSTAYGDVRDGAAAESWCARIGTWRSDRSPEIARRIASFGNTGKLRCKTIDLASEFDHLIPPKVHFEPYRRRVIDAGCGELYRGRLLPAAQHVDAWSEDPQYPHLRPGHPTVIEAWNELVAWVEGAEVKSR